MEPLTIETTFKKRARSSKLERAKRLRLISKWLELRQTRKDIVPRLMAKFDISRATAHRLVDTAEIQIETERQADWIEDPEPISSADTEALLLETRGLMYLVAENFKESKDLNYIQSFSKLANAYEKLGRMAGQASHM